MVQDEGKEEEEKLEFTPEGEVPGYISLDQARVLAMETARQTPGAYGRRLAVILMAFEVVEANETEDYYEVTLSFRPQGAFTGTPGQERFLIGKEGSVAHRQVLSLPTVARRRFPFIPAAIVLVVVLIVVVVGVVISSGRDGIQDIDVPVVAFVPTEAPIAIATPLPSAGAVPTNVPDATMSPAPARPPAVSPQQSVSVDRVFIRLTDPLDEPEYYCLDVPGAGLGVRLESALQVHTCKARATAADELFTLDHPKEGQIYMEAYDLCVEAEGANRGSSLRLQPCSDSPHQLFSFENDVIRISGGGKDGLCLAVAPGLGIPTSGPSHLRRALTLESCESIDPTLTRWSLGISVPTETPLPSVSQSEVTQTPLPSVTATLVPTPSSALYTNELWNYTLVVPSSWVVVDTNPSSVIMIEYLEDGSLAFIDIEVETVQPGVTTDEYAEIKIAEGATPESFESYNLDSLTQVMISGIAAWKATETFKRLTGANTRKGDE